MLQRRVAMRLLDLHRLAAALLAVAAADVLVTDRLVGRLAPSYAQVSGEYVPVAGSNPENRPSRSSVSRNVVA